MNRNESLFLRFLRQCPCVINLKQLVLCGTESQFWLCNMQALVLDVECWLFEEFFLFSICTPALSLLPSKRAFCYLSSLCRDFAERHSLMELFGFCSYRLVMTNLNLKAFYWLCTYVQCTMYICISLKRWVLKHMKRWLYNLCKNMIIDHDIKHTSTHTVFPLIKTSHFANFIFYFDGLH